MPLSSIYAVFSSIIPNWLGNKLNSEGLGVSFEKCFLEPPMIHTHLIIFCNSVIVWKVVLICSPVCDIAIVNLALAISEDLNMEGPQYKYINPIGCLIQDMAFDPHQETETDI